MKKLSQKDRQMLPDLFGMAAGLGIGIAGTTVIMALQQFCQEFKVYGTVVKIDIADFQSALGITVLSCAVSAICFWRLHKKGVWHFDRNDEEQKRHHIAQIELLIAGVSCGAALRIVGDMVALWLEARAIERKGVLFLGSVVSIKQLLFGAGGFLIAALCLHRYEKWIEISEMKNTSEKN